MDLGMAIERGTKTKLTLVTKSGINIQYRPLSDWEFDEIELKLLERVSNRDFLDFLYKTGAISNRDVEIPDNISIPALEHVRKERVYWIALAAVHEFYEQLDFNEASLERIKTINGVKELVVKVLEASGRSPESKEAVKSFRGKQIPEVDTAQKSPSP